VGHSFTAAEYDANFRRPMRAALPAGTAVYTLAGNHDMYGGGTG